MRRYHRGNRSWPRRQLRRRHWCLRLGALDWWLDWLCWRRLPILQALSLDLGDRSLGN